MKHFLSATTALGICFVADIAHACPVCFSGNTRNRTAYFVTFVILSILPLASIGGIVFWLKRRYAPS